jgi:hypothetical protein
VVQLHPKRFSCALEDFEKETVVVRLREMRLKRRHALMRGRGVTAAQQTFNLQGEGSSPSGPISFSCALSNVNSTIGSGGER